MKSNPKNKTRSARATSAAETINNRSLKNRVTTLTTTATATVKNTLLSNNKPTTIQWKPPRKIDEEFIYSGSQLRVDKGCCLAKSTIQDGNSAFGTLEVTKNMKIEWSLKIVQGTQVAIGVLQTPESFHKNAMKLRKMSNSIFCMDGFGYAYFGKDGGVMKGGKYRKYGAPFKAGDFVSILLDMVSNKLQFSKGAKSQGIAFSNIPTGRYRLAVMLPKRMHQVVIENVQLWEVDTAANS